MDSVTTGNGRDARAGFAHTHSHMDKTNRFSSKYPKMNISTENSKSIPCAITILSLYDSMCELVKEFLYVGELFFIVGLVL